MKGLEFDKRVNIEVFLLITHSWNEHKMEQDEKRWKETSIIEIV